MKKITVKYYKIKWTELKEKLGLKKDIYSVIVDFSDQSIRIYTADKNDKNILP